MTHPDLRSLIKQLEANGQLKRISVAVDSDQEISIIHQRVVAAAGPALLFENVKNSAYPLLTNLFGTPERVTMALGMEAAAIGEQLAQFATRTLTQGIASLWSGRATIARLVQSRLKSVASGPILHQCHSPAGLNALPSLKCWPLDGGKFFTLPLVHTIDPASQRGNLGIYRMQVFDAHSTGMHWQIQKGGGFHFEQAVAQGKPLPVSVIFGGPPALLFAAAAPLPEGIDERLLAAFILGKPLPVIRRAETGHLVPARAEFVLEGTVSPGDFQQEGPFGDHLGHYSYSAPFPVFRVHRILARKNAIMPATVVGKPPQEDFYLGEALQEMSLPILKTIKPGITDLWAYPETGFHPLAVAAIQQRYEGEALKQAWNILGEGQLSLTKILIMVKAGTNVRNFTEVSQQLWQHLDFRAGFHLLTPTAQDSLDFTGPAMNHGSRLILLATPPAQVGPERAPPPVHQIGRHTTIHADITGICGLGPAFLIVQVRAAAQKPAVRAALLAHPIASQFLFLVLVSEDVPLDDARLLLWGWFTRFDPATDIYAASQQIVGNRLLLQPPILIDATWKQGYRQPVQVDPVRLKQVDQNWSSYGLP